MKSKFYFVILAGLLIMGCQKKDTKEGDELTIEREEEYKGSDTSEVNPVP